MKDINLNLEDEIVKIKLTTADYGRDAVMIHLFRGDTPITDLKGKQFIIELQTEATARSSMGVTFNGDTDGFPLSIKKFLVEKPGEMLERIGIIDTFEGTADYHHAMWIVTE